MADAAQRAAAFAGILAVVATAAFQLADLGGVATRLRESAFDIVMRLSTPERGPPDVIVVDIDRESLAAKGNWPWRRGLIADLVAEIQKAEPKAIGIDILLRGSDGRSPGAVLRRLAQENGRQELAAMAQALPDDDARLADTLPRGDTVIGLALDPESEDAPPFPTSILSKGPLPVREMRRSDRVAAPLPAFSDMTAAVGVLSLQAGPGDLVRDVPLLSVGAGELYAGLSLETLRLSEGASAFLVEPSGDLRIGKRFVPLPENGVMRVHFSEPRAWAARTVRAATVLDGQVPVERLRGRIVLIGSSAPEAGARLATPVDPLTPTVQIQAEAIEQMRAGVYPSEPRQARLIEASSALVLAGIAVTLAVFLTPTTAVLAVLGLCGVWVALTFGLFATRQVLLDPAGPLLPALVGANVAALVLFGRTRRMRQAIERKFARYVSPEVVKRLTDSPEELKIEGEIREVTALFSDIEGFTTMTERAEPRALVAALDAYFDGVCAIIIKHGGMVDKLVGDAAHGLFNAPLDLKDHARRALDCAIEIDVFARAFREREGPKALGFGRTRIGFETGPVIVGDVGGLGHLDYTAHGDAVNSAARLEAINKTYGSTIAIGPRSAAAIGDAVRLRPLGRQTLRGRSGESLIRTVWLPDAPNELRDAYDAAFALIDTDRAEARARFTALAQAYPDEPVTAYWVRMLAEESADQPARR